MDLVHIWVNLRIGSSLAVFSSSLQTCRRTVLLDVGWVQSQVAATATAIVVVVLTVIVLTVIVLAVVLAVVVVLLLALTLTTLTALATLTTLAALTALTALPETSSTKASELGIGYTGCEQDWEKCGDPHGDGLSKS